MITIDRVSRALMGRSGNCVLLRKSDVRLLILMAKKSNQRRREAKWAKDRLGSIERVQQMNNHAPECPFCGAYEGTLHFFGCDAFMPDGSLRLPKARR